MSSISYAEWPKYDEMKIIDEEIKLPIQVNGKVKTTITIPLDSDEETVKNIAHNNSTIMRVLEGKNIVKEIYVKNKIYNIVAK